MKLNIKTPFLFCLSAAFCIWQMGIIYFSGTSLSLFGRIPIEINQDINTLVIASGYIISIIVMIIFPRKMVLIERFVIFLALFCTIGVLIPFSSVITATFYYIVIFCCVFSIGGIASIATTLFTVDTTWRDAIVGNVVGGIGIAILQNDFIRFDFIIFMFCSIVMIFALLFFLLKLPAKIEITFAKKSSNYKRPIIPLIGNFIFIIFPTTLLLMATSIAETIKHGVSIMYLSASVMAIFLNIIKVKLRTNSIKAFAIFFMLTPLGFVFTILSTLKNQSSSLGILACIFFGFSIVIANMWFFFSTSAFEIYPSRFIAAIGTGIGLVLALVHSVILESFRENLSILYYVYLVISIFLMILFYILEPYFIYSWKKTIEDKKISHNKKQSSIYTEEKKENAKIELLGMEKLSVQEENLAKLILQGYSESEIAKEMNITLNTQKSYRKNLYTKLNIHSRRELFNLLKN